MILRVLAALAVVVVLFWLYRQWQKLPSEKKRSNALKYLLYGIAVLCLLAVFSGRMHWLGAVLAGVLAFGKFGLVALFRALPLLNFLRRSPFVGQPKFRTAFLDIQIDLRNGQVNGAITSGPFTGRTIDDLNDQELQELESHYQKHDKASYFLIRVIRQRKGFDTGKHTGDYGDKKQQNENFQSVGNPSLHEAKQILGLGPNPTKKEIIAAHRSLIQKLHPDRGGNDYLASRVNLAKDVLMQQFK